MFLVNSRLTNFCCVPTCVGKSISPSLRSAFLPSSLNHHYPSALVFSTSPPASVCGTVRRKSLSKTFPGSLRRPPFLSCDRIVFIACYILRYNSQFNPSYRRGGLASFVIFEIVTIFSWKRNINRLDIGRRLKASALDPPNPRLIDIAEETLDIRHLEFSSRDSLLMSAFSLPMNSIPIYIGTSLSSERSPTSRRKVGTPSSVNFLVPIIFGAKFPS